MSDDRPPHDPVATLRAAATIRLRCAAVTRAVERGVSGWFTIDRAPLEALAGRVAAVLPAYLDDDPARPTGWWRRLGAGGVDRLAEVDARLADLPPDERLRAQLDLAVVGVLLDAESGSRWRYAEHAGVDRLALPAQRQQRDDLLAMLDAAATRPAGSAAATPSVSPSAPSEVPSDAPPDVPSSARPADPAPDAPSAAAPAAPAAPPALHGAEGRAVACLRAFLAGAFSSDPARPCRVDAVALVGIDAAALRAIFQSSSENPLPGVDGRAGLLVRLGALLRAKASSDGHPARPSDLLALRLDDTARTPVDAGALLGELLRALGPVWGAGCSFVGGQPVGDVWPHRWAGGETAAGRDPLTTGWVPLHTLAQRLVDALLRPLRRSGVAVQGLQALTAPADDIRGGLLLDAGVIVPRSALDLGRVWKPGDEFVVEWRALTVTLLDELAARVRALRGLEATGLPMTLLSDDGLRPLAAELAASRRPGAPAVRVDGDSTLL